MQLDLNQSTWLAFAAASCLWAVSVLLARDSFDRRGWSWRAVPLSFFGLAWIAFGATFILRFLALAIDAKFFRATHLPLWLLPAAELTRTLVCLSLYWGAFVISFVLMTRLSPRRPGLLEKLEALPGVENFLVLDLLVLGCSFLVILSGREFVPSALATPLGILGGFYTIAATIAWYGYFQGKPVGLRRFFYLVPGLLINYFSAFRALIFAAVLCVLIPALRTRRIVSFTKLLLMMAAILVIATVVNDYRRARWDHPTGSHGQNLMWNWLEKPEEAPWVRLTNRFHGFDSLALTVHFVPSVFPCSRLNIFSDLFWRVIPRAVTDKKPDTHRGREFSTTIWAMGERRLLRRSEANISPSMCADLYHINGIPLVLMGAVIYGLLVGLLENWQQRGSPLASCIFLAVFGVPVALGIEQEFNFATATLIQMLIAFFLLLAFFPLAEKVGKAARKLAVKKEGG